MGSEDEGGGRPPEEKGGSKPQKKDDKKGIKPVDDSPEAFMAWLEDFGESQRDEESVDDEEHSRDEDTQVTESESEASGTVEGVDADEVSAAEAGDDGKESVDAPPATERTSKPLTPEQRESIKDLQDQIEGLRVMAQLKTQKGEEGAARKAQKQADFLQQAINEGRIPGDDASFATLQMAAMKAGQRAEKGESSDEEDVPVAGSVDDERDTTSLSMPDRLRRLGDKLRAAGADTSELDEAADNWKQLGQSSESEGVSEDDVDQGVPEVGTSPSDAAEPADEDTESQITTDGGTVEIVAGQGTKPLEETTIPSTGNDKKTREAFDRGASSIEQGVLKDIIMLGDDPSSETLRRVVDERRDVLDTTLSEHGLRDDPSGEDNASLQSATAGLALASIHTAESMDDASKAALRSVALRQPIPPELQEPVARAVRFVSNRLRANPDFNAYRAMVQQLERMEKQDLSSNGRQYLMDVMKDLVDAKKEQIESRESDAESALPGSVDADAEGPGGPPEIEAVPDAPRANLREMDDGMPQDGEDSDDEAKAADENLDGTQTGTSEESTDADAEGPEHSRITDAGVVRVIRQIQDMRSDALSRTDLATATLRSKQEDALRDLLRGEDLSVLTDSEKMTLIYRALEEAKRETLVEYPELAQMPPDTFIFSEGEETQDSQGEDEPSGGGDFEDPNGGGSETQRVTSEDAERSEDELDDETIDTYIKYLSYSKTYPGRSREEHIEYLKENPNAVRYAQEIQRMVEVYGEEGVLDFARGGVEEIEDLFTSMGFTDEDLTMVFHDESWALWHAAKLSYYEDHPDEYVELENTDKYPDPVDPMRAVMIEGLSDEERAASFEAQWHVYTTHIGWELAVNPQVAFQRLVAGLRRDISSADQARIDELLREAIRLNDPRGLPSYQLQELGELVVRNSEQRDVYLNLQNQIRAARGEPALQFGADGFADVEGPSGETNGDDTEDEGPATSAGSGGAPPSTPPPGSPPAPPGSIPPGPPGSGGPGTPEDPDDEEARRLRHEQEILGAEMAADIELENRRYRGPTFGIFTERNVADAKASFDKHARGFIQANQGAELTDAQILEILRRVEQDHNRTVYRETDIDGRPVVFFEFDASDEEQCRAYGESSDSLCVDLMLDERKEDFTLDQLRVLRTFDTKGPVLAMRDPETGEELRDVDGNLIREEQFLVDYFNGEHLMSDGVGGFLRYDNPSLTPEQRTGIYENYRDTLASLLFQLHANAKTDLEGGMPESSSTDMAVAKHIKNRLDTIINRAKRLENSSGDNPQKLEVGIEIPRIDRSDQRLTAGPRARSSGESEWSRETRVLHKAFKGELRPMAENIMKMAPEINAGRANTHNPDVSMDALVQQNKRMNSVEVAYLSRHAPLLDQALQDYLVGLQMDISQSDRLILGDFGMIDGSTGEEIAESNAIALMKARFVAEHGREPEKHEEGQIEYAVTLASGLHKVYTGKYWDVLASVLEGELMNGRDESGRRTTPMMAEQSAVVKKLREITVVEPEMYRESVAAVFGVPCERYMGITEKIPGFPPVQKWTLREYERVVDLFRTARRGDDNRLARMLKRRFRFLGDTLNQRASAFLSGKSRIGQIVQDIDVVKGRIQTDPERTPMQVHADVMSEIMDRWGAQGVVVYIDKNLDRMIQDDPAFDDVQALIERTEQAAIVEEKARRGSVKQKFKNRWNKTKDWFSTNDWEKPSVIEPVRKKQDEARAKYYKDYLYNELFRRNKSLLLLFESRSTTPINGLVRDRMEDWMIRNVQSDLTGTDGVTEQDFRLFELVAHHQYGNGNDGSRPLPPAVVKIIADTIGLEVTERNLDPLTEQCRRFMRHYDRELDSYMDRIVTEFATEHALGIGSYAAQIAGLDTPHSQMLSHYIGQESMKGVKSRIELKPEQTGLFGVRQKLTKLGIKDRASAIAAGETIAEELRKLAEPLSANPDEQLRFMAELIVETVPAVIDNGNNPSIYDRNPADISLTDDDSRHDLRFFFALELMEQLGIPKSEVSVTMNADGSYSGKLNSVRQADIFKALGDDLQARRWALSAEAAARRGEKED